MAEELVSLSDYPDQFQAEAIRIRLEAAGIQVIVTGTDAATALSMGGAGTDRLVRVEVAKADYEKAMKLLLEDKERLESASPWICSRCDEQNEPAFEVCWGCNKTQTEDDKLGRRDDLDESTTLEPDDISVESGRSDTKRLGTTNDSNPFRPVLIDGKAEGGALPQNSDKTEYTYAATEAQEESVRRAFLSSIAALLIVPPLLSIYSVTILLSLGAEPYYYPQLKLRFIAAWVINLIVIVVATMFWWGVFSS